MGEFMSQPKIVEVINPILEKHGIPLDYNNSDQTYGAVSNTYLAGMYALMKGHPSMCGSMDYIFGGGTHKAAGAVYDYLKSHGFETERARDTALEFEAELKTATEELAAAYGSAAQKGQGGSQPSPEGDPQKPNAEKQAGAEQVRDRQ